MNRIGAGEGLFACHPRPERIAAAAPMYISPYGVHNVPPPCPVAFRSVTVSFRYGFGRNAKVKATVTAELDAIGYPKLVKNGHAGTQLRERPPPAKIQLAPRIESDELPLACLLVDSVSSVGPAVQPRIGVLSELRLRVEQPPEDALQFFHGLRIENDVGLMAVCRSVDQFNVTQGREPRDLTKDVRPQVVVANFGQLWFGAKRMFSQCVHSRTPCEERRRSAR